MALNWQTIPISLREGVDTKTDFKQVVPGKLITVENGVFTSIEEIRKRNGYGALPLGLASGQLLSSYQNELIALDGTSLYSYTPLLNTATNKGPVSSAEVTLTSIAKNGGSLDGADVAWHSSGLQLVTWTDHLNSGNARYSIIDSVTGDNIVYNLTVASGATIAKPLAFGNYFIIVYQSTSSHLSYISIPVATPTSPNAPVTVATDYTNIGFDACIISTRLFITWFNTSGGSKNVSLKYLTTALALSSEQTYTSASNISYITAWPDLVLQQVWVVYSSTTSNTVEYLITDFNLSASPVLGATVIQTGIVTYFSVGYASNGSGSIWIDIAGIPYDINKAMLTNTGTVTGLGLFLTNLMIAAKPFIYNSVIYLLIEYVASQDQPTYFVVNTATKQVISKMLPGVAQSANFPAGHLPEVVSQIAGLFAIPVNQIDLLTTAGGSISTLSGIALSNLNFLSKKTYFKTILAENLEISGSVLNCYDGQNIVEQNFHLFPEILAATPSNTGGSLGNASVATLYSYIATYEWTDNQGQIQRSTTSIVSSNSQSSFSSGVVTGKVVLTIQTLPITQKTQVRIVIYRTQGNGTVFYQITNISSPLFNDPTVESVMFTDTQADSVIIGDAILYTTGGVVDNAAPPASSYITSYQDRMILFPSENKNQFWFTKSIVPGTPIEFSASFTWNVDSRGGDLICAQQLDDKLVLFKEDTVLYMTGQGPDDTGGNNDFSAAQILPFDVGSINGHSIISYPGGLIFQSNKGIFQLDRGLNPSYIGADVEFYNNQYITSASIVPNTTQLRFSLSSGVVLMYDYFVRSWAVFTNLNAQDSTLFQDLFTYIQPNGTVLQETIGSFTDNGAFIKLKIVTSWLSFAKLQGFQRMKSLYILGDYISPHSLVVKVAYDFQPSFTQTNTIPVTSDPTLLGLPYEWRIDLQEQKSTSIQFSVEDSQTMPFGAGMTISNFNFMAGLKQGLNKLPPSQIYA